MTSKVEQLTSDDAAAKKRTTAPFWWPDSNVIMQMFLAAAIVWIVWYIIKQLLSGEALKIDPSVRDLVVFIFGIIFGNFKDVYGYTFGSSAGQKRQGEVITQSLEAKDRLIATTAAATADVATTTAAAVAATAAAGADPAKDPKVVVAWWSLLTDKERSDIGLASLTDAKVKVFQDAAQTRAAAPDDLDYLVSKSLLTKDRADKLKAA